MDAMPGDAEAAGAVAGMIETTGAKPTRRLWQHYVGSIYEQYPPQPFTRGVWAMDELAIDGLAKGQLLLRNAATGRVEVFNAGIGRALHVSKAKALAAVLETLIERREALTREIASVKAELQAEVEGAGDRLVLPTGVAGEEGDQ